jgi:hypothetical protein
VNVAEATLEKQAVGCKKGGTQAEFRRGHLERFRCVQDLVEENHCILWMEFKILEIETNSVFRKYKKEAYTSCLQNPISRPSTDISI